MNTEQIEVVEEELVEFANLEEEVSLAGGEPTQVTGRQAGRVLGLGC
jgi:tetrahydromethanopterin S-methyltransferase subunit G